METNSYDVEISTPLGVKNGIMKICINGDNITGTLDILGGVFPLCGKMLGKSTCEISGSFRTAMNTFYYRADGKLNKNGITLTMNGGISTYSLTGKKSAS